MQALLTKAYEAEIAKGVLDDDRAQRLIVARLDALALAMAGYEPNPEGSLLDRLFGKTQKPDPPKGVYIHGDVGRGKTMLMDLLFDAVESQAKRRDHFLNFMQDVHSRIHDVRKQQRTGEIWEDADPIQIVAEQIGKGTHLLCFDEFQVTDITDALMLGRLFEALFGLGVVVVATSNVHPSDLYKDGLNRNSFLPFIDVLKARVDIMSLDSETDYRLGRLAGKKIYYTPLGAKADKAIQALWFELTEVESGAPHTLTIKGRELIVPQSARGVARFSFSDLCESALGAADYIAIGAAYRTVFVERVPIIAPENRNEAKRFITLIDALYDRRTKLIVSAAGAPDELYPQGPHQFEFDRTISRLNEMQSGAYFDA